MMFSRQRLFASVLVLASLAGCQSGPQQSSIDESEKANAFFDRVFDERVDRHPEYQTQLGIRKDYGIWNDTSDENAGKELNIAKQELENLRALIDYDLLDPQTKISYDLFVRNIQQQVDLFKYRLHTYPIDQMYGRQSGIPSFLMNRHRISELSDAQAYISRLELVGEVMDQLIVNMTIREEQGIIPPSFVFAHAIRDSNNIINGDALISDFRSKIVAVENLDDASRAELLQKAQQAISKVVIPAYQTLIGYLVELEKKSNTDDGVWKLPDGRNFYAAALKRRTTTDLTAEEIHNLGLSEVERIHNDIRRLMQSIGFDGDLQDFFEFMRTDKRFIYANDDKGRNRYLSEATQFIEAMKAHLDDLFLVKPVAELLVKKVEAFREQSAGTAFYQRPAPDGSRPGLYYANLYNMDNMPSYKMEALAYHEGVPGHHMQIAIAQELQGIPKFRKFGSFTAYIEGWALYSELLPKEIGFYSDPYSDFGRLSMELWRACRLVVDTGIHDKKWTRQQAIDYYRANTANPDGEIVKMVERHIVMPGQATAYKIGMIRIIELREKAKQQLGADFDIRAFHNVILTSGAVPLDVLEKLVDQWIADFRSGRSEVVVSTLRPAETGSFSNAGRSIRVPAKWQAAPSSPG